MRYSTYQIKTHLDVIVVWNNVTHLDGILVWTDTGIDSEGLPVLATYLKIPGWVHLN